MSKNGLIPGSIKKIQILDFDKKYYYKNNKKNVTKQNKEKDTNNKINNDIIIPPKNNYIKKNNCQYQNKYSKQNLNSNKNQNNYVKIYKSKENSSSTQVMKSSKNSRRTNNTTATNNTQNITRSISICTNNQSANHVPKILSNKLSIQEKNHLLTKSSSNSTKKEKNEISDDYLALSQNKKSKIKKNEIKIIFERTIPKNNIEIEKNSYSYLKTSFANLNKELNISSISENNSLIESEKENESENENINFHDDKYALENKIHNLRNKNKGQNKIRFNNTTNNSIVGSNAFNLQRLDYSPQDKNNSKSKKDTKKGRNKKYTIYKNKISNNYLKNYINCSKYINSKIDKRTDSTGIPNRINKLNILTISSNSKQMNNSYVINTFANYSKSKKKERDKEKFNNTITKNEKNRNINYSCSKISSTNKTKNLTTQKNCKINNTTNINRLKKNDMNSKIIIENQQQKHFDKNNKKFKSPVKNNKAANLYSTKVFSSNNSCDEFSLNQTTTTNNPNFNYSVLSNKEEIKNFEKNNDKNKHKISKIHNINLKIKSHFGSQSCKNISSANEPNTSNICSITNSNSKSNLFDENKKLKNQPFSKIIKKTKKIKNYKEIKEKMKIYQNKQPVAVKSDNQIKNNMIEISNKTRRNNSNCVKNKNNNQSKSTLNKDPISSKKFLIKYKNYLKNYEIDELKNLNKKGELVYYLGEISQRIKNEEKTYFRLNKSFDNSNENDTTINNKNENNRPKTCINFNKIYCEEIKNIKKEFTHYSFNDKDGDFIARKGWHINYRYEILKCLGKGSFGEAIKCFDHKNNDFVCIKIINSHEKFQNQALVEIKIVSEIAKYDINNDSNNVKFYNYFKFRGHICLVFECLSINLFEFIESKNFIGLDIQVIRNYTIQILFALLFLRRINIIHCDLKPENILLLPNNENQIKIIDFGSSCFEKEKLYSYIQSRFYRAPEIIFENGYSFEIDMWSLGCILCELYTGQPIFPGMDEKEQILYMIDLLGNPPSNFIEDSPKKEYLFDEDYKDYCDNDSETDKLSNIKIKKLKKFLNKAPDSFISFINKCLMWDSSKRLTPEQALFHPFIIENMNESSLYKHKLKVKHIKHYINNYAFKKNNEKLSTYYNYDTMSNKKRGRSCYNKKMKHKNKLNISLSKINENSSGFSKEKLYTNNYYEIEKNYKHKYTLTNNNINNVSYASHYSKKKKNDHLSLDTEINAVRNVTESNNNQKGFYKSFFIKKKKKHKDYYHLPKKQSLGRTKKSAKNQ